MGQFLIFEQLAKDLFDELPIDLVVAPCRETPVGVTLMNALRDVWNKRRAAEMFMIDASLSSQMGPIAAGPHVKNLKRALRCERSHEICQRRQTASEKCTKGFHLA